jgi:transposase
MTNTLLSQLKIIKLMEIKPNFSELQRIYGIDRRTIKKYYNGYEGKPKYHNKKSMLDEYYDVIKQKMSIRGIHMKAVYEFLKDNYKNIGSYSNFRKYINRKGLKPQKAQKGHPRYETAPGKQAQIDWKEDIKFHFSDGTEIMFNVFNYKLSASRYCNYTYKRTRTRQDVIDCLIQAFKNTGGIPQELLFDNMASVVDILSNRKRVNSKMKHFANDFGFDIKLCKTRHSFTKGKVESNNKFIEWIMPYDYELKNENELIQKISEINKKVNMYNCQATGVPPLLLFQREKEHLKPLPNIKIIESYMELNNPSQVHKDSLIYYKGIRYSVPPEYIGKYVYVNEYFDTLQIYFNTNLIAVHTKSKKKINYNHEDYYQLMKSRSKSEDIEKYAEDNLNLLDQLL